MISILVSGPPYTIMFRCGWKTMLLRAGVKAEGERLRLVDKAAACGVCDADDGPGLVNVRMVGLELPTVFMVSILKTATR